MIVLSETSLRSLTTGSRATRARAPGWLAATAPMLLVLSACYQTPDWADPVEWAHEASYQVNSAIQEIKKRRRESDMRGAASARDPLTPAEAPPAPVEKEAEPPKAMEATTPVKPPAHLLVKKPPEKVAPPAPKPASAPMPTKEPAETVAAAAMEDPRAVEKQALESAPEPPQAEMPAPAAEAAEKQPSKSKATKPARTSMAETEYAVHLASYRKVKTVQKEWARLVNAHPEHLMGLRLRVAPVDLGPDRGKFLRLKAGPLPGRDFAKKLCRALKKKGLYCAVMRFTGRQLG